MAIYYSLHKMQQQYRDRPDIIAINLYRHGRYRMAMHFWRKNVDDPFCVQHYGRKLTPREAWRMLVVQQAVV